MYMYGVYTLEMGALLKCCVMLMGGGGGGGRGDARTNGTGTAGTAVERQ